MSFTGTVTRSGAEVTPTTGVPTLDDSAYALVRQPRFAGHTTHWWTVLHHSLLVSAMALDVAGPRAGAGWSLA